MGECPTDAYAFVVVRVRPDETADRLAPYWVGDDGLAVLVELPLPGAHPVSQCPVGTHSLSISQRPVLDDGHTVREKLGGIQSVLAAPEQDVPLHRLAVNARADATLAARCLDPSLHDQYRGPEQAGVHRHVRAVGVDAVVPEHVYEHVGVHVAGVAQQLALRPECLQVRSFHQSWVLRV